MARPERGDPALEYLAHRIAMVLEQHYEISRGLVEYLDPSTSPVLRPSRSKVIESLESLRALRGRLLEDFMEAGSRAGAAGEEDLKDLYVLASFFVEVGYGIEAKALEAAAREMLDVGGDYAELEEVRRVAAELANRLGEELRRLDPTWPSWRVGRQPL